MSTCPPPSTRLFAIVTSLSSVALGILAAAFRNRLGRTTFIRVLSLALVLDSESSGSPWSRSTWLCSSGSSGLHGAVCWTRPRLPSHITGLYTVDALARQWGLLCQALRHPGAAARLVLAIYDRRQAHPASPAPRWLEIHGQRYVRAARLKGLP